MTTSLPARRRSGATAIGCLFSLLVTAVVIYFAINAFEVYWRYVSFRDQMQQQVRFAGQHTDAQIERRLIAVADSLSLPEDARDLLIRRTGRQILIEAEYDDYIQLPFYIRVVRFTPRAEGPF